MINENPQITSKAYWKSPEERTKAVEKIKERRKPFIIYQFLPEREKQDNIRRTLKYGRLNPNKVNIIHKKWRHKNVEKLNQKRKEYYLLNKTKDKCRTWARYHREEILKELGDICNNCQNNKNIETHHKKYTNNLEDMEVLCRKCHRALSRKYTDEELGIKIEETKK